MGKPKPSTRDLPDSNFSYGKKLKPDDEGVGSLLSSWAEHKSSIKPKGDKDFKKLNALSVAEGACTAPKQRKFRQEADVRIRSSSQKNQVGVPNMIFGMSARPSTPIKAVIGNFYGEYASGTNVSNYTPKAPKNNIPTTKSTKGFDKRSESIKNAMQPQDKEIFKIKKFLFVQAKTNTGRK